MSQLTRSVIDLAPDVRESLENELTTPNVNNIPKEPPVEKKVESTPVDSEEVKEIWRL